MRIVVCFAIVIGAIGVTRYLEMGLLASVAVGIIAVYYTVPVALAMKGLSRKRGGDP